MTYSNDYWVWSEPQLTINDIKEANQLIREEHAGYEEKSLGAYDEDGKPLKCITPKTIFLGTIAKLPILYNLIQQGLFTCNYKFGYSTFGLNPHDTLLLNEYSAERKESYGSHHDTSQSDIYDLKMTLLINLSEEEYEGGDFIVNSNNLGERFKKPGSMILFRSHLLHEVTPMIKGNRKTLAHFIGGPKFL